MLDMIYHQQAVGMLYPHFLSIYLSSLHCLPKQMKMNILLNIFSELQMIIHYVENIVL